MKKTKPKKPAKKTEVLYTSKPIDNKTAKLEDVNIHYLMILDKSGSMSSVSSKTIEGFNSQLANIEDLVKQFPDQKYLVSLVTFADDVNSIIDDKPISDITPLTNESYRPSGSTALYDAIGNSVKKLAEKIDPNPNARAIVIILTDGEENASRQYKSDMIKKLIGEKNATDKWTFVFVGANQDAALSAQSIGIDRSNSLNYASTNVGTTTAFDMLNRNTRLYSVRTAKSRSATPDSLDDLSKDFFEDNDDSKK